MHNVNNFRFYYPCGDIWSPQCSTQPNLYSLLMFTSVLNWLQVYMHYFQHSVCLIMGVRSRKCQATFKWLHQVVCTTACMCVCMIMEMSHIIDCWNANLVHHMWTAPLTLTSLMPLVTTKCSPETGSTILHQTAVKLTSFTEWIMHSMTTTPQRHKHGDDVGSTSIR